MYHIHDCLQQWWENLVYKTWLFMVSFFDKISKVWNLYDTKWVYNTEWGNFLIWCWWSGCICLYLGGRYSVSKYIQAHIMMSDEHYLVSKHCKVNCLLNILFWLRSKKPLKLSSLAFCEGNLGAVSIRKTVLPGMAIPMLKIRRPNGRLIFNMEITIRR